MPADITRRQVLRTAAWTAPVVAVAVATPMAAASLNDPDPARTFILTPTPYATPPSEGVEFTLRAQGGWIKPGWFVTLTAWGDATFTGSTTDSALSGPTGSSTSGQVVVVSRTQLAKFWLTISGTYLGYGDGSGVRAILFNQDGEVSSTRDVYLFSY